MRSPIGTLRTGCSIRVPEIELSRAPLTDGRGPGVDWRIVVATGICVGCGGCELEEKLAWCVLKGGEPAGPSLAAA
jgi:hypothetical protein